MEQVNKALKEIQNKPLNDKHEMLKAKCCGKPKKIRF